VLIKGSFLIQRSRPYAHAVAAAGSILLASAVTCAKPAKAPATGRASKPAAAETAPASAELPTSPEATEAGGAAKPGPDAAAVTEARSRFGRGIELYEDGDFELALIEFQRAHELVSNYRVLYNIGQVSVQLRQYARARTALEAYLAQGGSDIEPERAAEVGADIAMLKTRTALVLVSTKRPGAQVLLNGIPVGVTPLAAPLLVDAGEHRVEVRQAGFRPVERFVTLAGGDDQQIEIELTEVAEGTRTVEKQTIVVNKPSTATDTTWTWVGFGATAVLGAGAVATGIFGLTATSDLENLRNTPDVSRNELESASSRGKRMFLASDILAATAIVVGGTTLYFVLTADDSSAEAKPKLKAGLSPAGVSLSGVF
jgi:tetratricopeptide (TPR) repeat protein